MGTAVVQLIPVALGFALSPIPLVEMVLVLFSRRALTNGLVFLACIMLPVFVIPFLGAAGQDAAATTASERSTTQGVILIVVAAALLVIAWRNFRARHSTSIPKVFGKIEGMGPLAVILLSGGVTIANPKNLVILLGAGSVAGQQGLPAAQLAVTLAIFTIIATAPFLVMVGYLAFRGTAATRNLDRWRQWLLRNNHLIMAIVLAVLGVVLAIQGAGAL